MLIFAIDSEADRGGIEDALGVRFEAHDSLHLGGDYWLACLPTSDTAIRIRRNVDLLWSEGDPDDERFAYPEHAEHSLLLEVDGEDPADAELLKRLRALPSLKLLTGAELAS